MLHQFIQSAMAFIENLGVWGILLGLMLEVIPSELVLSYAGYLASLPGGISVFEAILFGTIGCVLQQLILYYLSRYGGRPFLNKYGKYLLLKPKYIDLTERWFQQYGPGMVFVARFLPVVRQAISIPAGLARMNLAQFILYTTLGTVPWAILFVYLGRALGSNWEQIDEYASQYTKPVIIAVIVLIVLFVIYKVLTRKKGKPAQ
ncbi:DedA family protein [Paenibacillus sp. TAB 01]|uniref:DedA family protein n=1 Tax=Paenibacillus sp. TAB 01 TaxID=3368988 RepID=UPI003752DE4A